MPRCNHTIPSTKRKCQKNAIEGSCYCTIHHNKINKEVEPVEEPKEQPIFLPLPPIPDEPMQETSEEVEQQVTINTESQATSILQNQVDNLVSIVDKLTKALNEKCLIQPTKTKKQTKITDKAVYKKAQWMYYTDFKSKHQDIIANLTQAGIQGNFLVPNTKLPWVHVKYASDQYFEQLDEVNKRMYLDSARTLLNNKNNS
jgi:type III secretory pathway component EscV